MAKRPRSKRECQVPPNPNAAHEWYKRRGPFWTRSRGWHVWAMRRDQKIGYEIWADSKNEAKELAERAEFMLAGI